MARQWLIPGGPAIDEGEGSWLAPGSAYLNGAAAPPVQPTPPLEGVLFDEAIYTPLLSRSGDALSASLLLDAYYVLELAVGQTAPTGGLAFGGSTTAQRVRLHTHAPAGGLAFGGAPIVQHATGEWPHAPTGGLALGGTAPVEHDRAHNPSGGLALGAAPTIRHAGGAQIHVASGGLALGATPTITRRQGVGLYSVEWVHQRTVQATRYDAIAMTHTRTLREVLNGDGLLQVHTRAIGSAALRALSSHDLQRPVATGEIIIPE